MAAISEGLDELASTVAAFFDPPSLGANAKLPSAAAAKAAGDATKKSSGDTAKNTAAASKKDTKETPKKDQEKAPNALADSAYKMIGTSTAEINGTENGTLGCAAAVSMMFKDATGENILPKRSMVLGTGELHDGLSKDPRFIEVPFDEAQPGDIVVTARGTKAGHTGIVGNNGEIISNSSSGFKGSEPGTIQNNYTLDSWKRTVTPRNPDKTSVFRYSPPSEV